MSEFKNGLIGTVVGAIIVAFLGYLLLPIENVNKISSLSEDFDDIEELVKVNGKKLDNTMLVVAASHPNKDLIAKSTAEKLNNFTISDIYQFVSAIREIDSLQYASIGMVPMDSLPPNLRELSIKYELVSSDIDEVHAFIKN